MTGTDTGPAPGICFTLLHLRSIAAYSDPEALYMLALSLALLDEDLLSTS